MADEQIGRPDEKAEAELPEECKLFHEQLRKTDEFLNSLYGEITGLFPQVLEDRPDAGFELQQLLALYQTTSEVRQEHWRRHNAKHTAEVEDELLDSLQERLQQATPLTPDEFMRQYMEGEKQARRSGLGGWWTQPPYSPITDL